MICLLAFPGTSQVFGAEVTRIKHLIVVMQENHSFDNYFGTYPTANGSLVNSITSKLSPVDGLPQGVCLPQGSTCVAPYLS
ncbi:MAG TPA: alkaline phosphatase family protein, partial [Methylomirabilota bacterium]|nr:alkaline phosphatase family protein [Methylomirabilota bacterium]